jgi:outer membrane protein OmpA-like peptidoglycan-associated protein
MISRLLVADGSLKLYIVGHTDDTGSPSHNLDLSKRRAKAVVQELMSKYGVAEDRLAAFGAGPYVPMASNDSETGKAKNRRVELVKRLD